MEYYDLDETYKDFVKILLTVHKRVYDMKQNGYLVLPRRKEYEEYKYKEYQGKCFKNFSVGVNARGVFVLGG